MLWSDYSIVFSSFLKNKVLAGVGSAALHFCCTAFLSLEEKANVREKSKEGVRSVPFAPSLLHYSLRLFSLSMIVRLHKIGKCLCAHSPFYAVPLHHSFKTLVQVAHKTPCFIRISHKFLSCFLASGGGKWLFWRILPAKTPRCTVFIYQVYKKRIGIFPGMFGQHLMYISYTYLL